MSDLGCCRVIPLFLVFAAGTVALDLRLANAVDSDAMGTVRTLLAHNVDVDVAQVDGTTPLLWAAHNDNLSADELLLQGPPSYSAREGHADCEPAASLARNGGVAADSIGDSTGKLEV